MPLTTHYTHLTCYTLLQAKKSLNKYTTTLHAVNSSIIKVHAHAPGLPDLRHIVLPQICSRASRVIPPLCVRVKQLGKLTKATKVYRGVSGMALPEQFWCVFSPVCVAPTPDL